MDDIKWVRFKDIYPRDSDFPIWIYDSEYKTLELVLRIEHHIFVTKTNVKKQLFWGTAPIKKPNPPTDLLHRCLREEFGMKFTCYETLDHELLLRLEWSSFLYHIHKIKSCPFCGFNPEEE
jgi:hypothetical protein